MTATWECPYCGEGKEEFENSCYMCRHEVSLAWNYLQESADKHKTLEEVRKDIGKKWPRAMKIFQKWFDESLLLEAKQ